jgi:hypothetical protein
VPSLSLQVPALTAAEYTARSTIRHAAPEERWGQVFPSQEPVTLPLLGEAPGMTDQSVDLRIDQRAYRNGLDRVASRDLAVTDGTCVLCTACCRHVRSRLAQFGRAPRGRSV